MFKRDREKAWRVHIETVATEQVKKI